MKQRLKSLKDKIDLIEAAIVVADFWGVEPADLVFWVAIGEKDKVGEWNKIAKEVAAFGKAPFEERAKMLGIKLTTG